MAPLMILLLLATSYPATLFAHEVHDEPHIDADSRDPRSLLLAFRQSGDDALLDEAWALLHPELGPGATSTTLVDAAAIAQARHRFDDAERLLADALSRDPRNDQAWLLAHTIAMVKADSVAAERACRALTDAEILVVLTCHARVALLTGKAADASLVLERVLELDSGSKTATAWAASIAGDLAAEMGDEKRAVRHFRHSLSLVESTQVRSALVDALLRDGRLAEAHEALEAGSHALPLDVRRLIVDGLLDSSNSESTARVDRTFREWIAAGDWLHAREMARFYLDVTGDVELAARLASINIRLQREPEDIRLLDRATRAAVQ